MGLLHGDQDQLTVAAELLRGPGQRHPLLSMLVLLLSLCSTITITLRYYFYYYYYYYELVLSLVYSQHYNTIPH